MGMQLAKHEEFLAIYNELDRFLRNKLDEKDDCGHVELLEKMAETNPIFKQNLNKLKSFARLRNAIVHNPYSKKIQPIADPHQFIIDEYRSIKNYVLNPPKAIDELGVCVDKLYTTSLNEPAIEVMKIMNERIFTHVPILKDGVLVGVFSENTIFSYMAKKGDILLERDVKIEEFKEYLPIDKHESEAFDFMSRNSLVIEVKERFNEFFTDGKRLAAVFITQNGKANERILKMITAWDVASYKEKAI